MKPQPNTSAARAEYPVASITLTREMQIEALDNAAFLSLYKDFFVYTESKTVLEKNMHYNMILDIRRRFWNEEVKLRQVLAQGGSHSASLRRVGGGLPSFRLCAEKQIL